MSDSPSRIPMSRKESYSQFAQQGSSIAELQRWIDDEDEDAGYRCCSLAQEREEGRLGQYPPVGLDWGQTAGRQAGK